jgi:SAM-dependent methyltransferase
MPKNSFVDGTYLQKVPLWHTDDSPWKAQLVHQMLVRNNILPRTVGEVGCGAGEVLRQLQLQMDSQCTFWGYDIAPEAISLGRSRENPKLHFRLGNICQEPNPGYDVLLVLDVMEHQENYCSFLREIKRLAPYKIFHTVLDLTVLSLARDDGLTERRRLYDDIHFFTKDTALQAVRQEDYEVLDWFYAPRAMFRSSTITQKIKQWPRKCLFTLNKDFAVRLLGGYSLFVLAK